MYRGPEPYCTVQHLNRKSGPCSHSHPLLAGGVPQSPSTDHKDRLAVPQAAPPQEVTHLCTGISQPGLFLCAPPLPRPSPRRKRVHGMCKPETELCNPHLHPCSSLVQSEGSTIQQEGIHASVHGIKHRDPFSTPESTGPVTSPGPRRDCHRWAQGGARSWAPCRPPGHPPNPMGQKGLGLSKHSGAGVECKELAERHRGQ